MDVGDRRIGGALSDPGGILATPFAVIERKEDTADAGAIVSIVKDQQVGRIIIGLPQTLGGKIGQQAEKVQAFVETLRRNTSVPIEVREERLTTVSAKRLRRDTGAKEKKKKMAYDAIAAALILQSYLDESREYGHNDTGDSD